MKQVHFTGPRTAAKTISVTLRMVPESFDSTRPILVAVDGYVS